MTYYGICINGTLDCDPKPRIFRTYNGAVEFLNGSDAYDPDETAICLMNDDIAEWILEEYDAEAGE